MIPWKILKFEVAKDVISRSLGAEQGEVKLPDFNAFLELLTSHQDTTPQSLLCIYLI